jgi:hypothetical protein
MCALIIKMDAPGLKGWKTPWPFCVMGKSVMAVGLFNIMCL